MKPREFWIVWAVNEGPDWPAVYNFKPNAWYHKAELIHVREVTGPDYKAIAEELMRALDFYARPSTYSERVNPYSMDYDFCKGGPASNAQSGKLARETPASAKKRLGE